MPTTTPSTIPSTVRTELLDCIQVNLAVLADRYHGPDSHLVLGAVLRFRPGRLPETALPTVEPPVAQQVEECVARLGLTVREAATDLSGAGTAELAGDGGTVYAVGDAYGMPWLPYAGKRHMAHSFLVRRSGDRALVTDAYHNETRWGPAVPGRWTVGWDELPRVQSAVRFAPAAGGVPRAAPAVDVDPPSAYLAAYEQCPDPGRAVEQLTVETWLLARSRGLHAAYRDRSGGPAGPEVEAHVRQWNELAVQAFITLRRLHRGGAGTDALLTRLAAALAADSEVFGGARAAANP
ncbi:hypothetical protein CUT44_24665 [Streptomyces carminius]|uniref:Uncharacterized protein n=1 Tax=Streptomyces carminius TaxID=2665496 RepID=A0A2M8LSF3_9ACTN|nr:hypothetical protein [Streptomyces carminius]PJE94883.1 hypothetical protein CUT44_24665 [Streptomyces carminius]